MQSVTVTQYPVAVGHSYKAAVWSTQLLPVTFTSRATVSRRVCVCACEAHLDTVGGAVQDLEALQGSHSAEGHIGLPLCKHPLQAHLGQVQGQPLALVDGQSPRQLQRHLCTRHMLSGTCGWSEPKSASRGTCVYDTCYQASAVVEGQSPCQLQRHLGTRPMPSVLAAS